MKRNFSKIKVFLALGVILGFMFITANKSPSQTTQEPVKKRGLLFTVPEDWPIEERGGVVAPIPIEEYVTRKFKDIESRLEKIKQDLSQNLKDSANAKLESSIVQNDIPLQLKEISARLESIGKDVDQLKGQGEPSTGSGKQIESQIKDIRNETQVLRTWVEDLERRLRKIEFHLDM